MATKQSSSRNVGAANPESKLTDDKVRAMRKMYAETNLGYREIAETFGVAVRTAYQAITGLTWRHVT